MPEVLKPLPFGLKSLFHFKEMPSENATAAASQVQEPEQSDGLILVETDTAALKAWAAQPEVQTERGMRRSEQPKPLEPVTVPAENMILIETRKD